MTVTADSDSKLLRVASPVAKDVQIHEMSMKDDVMRMGPVDSITLPAGTPVKLDPDGYHVMLMGLTGQIKEGRPGAADLDRGKRQGRAADRRGQGRCPRGWMAWPLARCIDGLAPVQSTMNSLAPTRVEERCPSMLFPT
jgi:hypothetical protein